MGKKILIIDDDAYDRDIMERTFSEAGFDNVVSARNGEEGIKLAEEVKPDIVVLDTKLPGMDGFETCKKIKEIEQGKIKVIIITGFVDAVDAVKAKQMGADDYTVKTTDSVKIIEVVKQFI